MTTRPLRVIIDDPRPLVPLTPEQRETRRAALRRSVAQGIWLPPWRRGRLHEDDLLAMLMAEAPD